MILLKEEFCWEWKDVLYFVTNQRAERKEVNLELAKKMENWNLVDTRIYSKANNSFWEKFSKISNLEEKQKTFQKELGISFYVSSLV